MSLRARLRSILLLAVLVAACGLFPTEPAGEGEGVLGSWVRSNEVVRTYTLHLPAAYTPARRWPLLILFHGAGDTGHDFEPRIGMAADLDSAGVIAVYPDGVDSNWAAGCGCTRADLDHVDDVRFVRTLLNQLIDSLAVDTANIFVGGYSQGAMMTQRLVCDMADRLAGGINVSATLPAMIASDCKPSRSVPMLFFHGTADTTFKWDGMDRAGQHYYSVSQTVTFFAQANGCVSAPQTVVDTTLLFNPTPVQTVRYPTCRRGQVTLVQIDGGGHTWPDSPGPWPAWLGPVSHRVHARSDILKFLGVSLPATP